MDQNEQQISDAGSNSISAATISRGAQPSAALRNESTTTNDSAPEPLGLISKVNSSTLIAPVAKAMGSRKVTTNMGIGETLRATIALRQSLTPNLAATDFLKAYSSASGTVLSNLTRLNDVLKPRAFESSFSVLNSTLTRLTAAAAFSEKLGAIAIQNAERIAALQKGVSLSTFAITQQIAAPYLGVAASMLSFESQMIARVNDLGASVSRALSTSGLVSLQRNLASLSLAANATWKDMDRFATLQATTIEWLRKPAIELYTATHVVAAVADEATEHSATDQEIEESIDEQDAGFESRLERLNQDLVLLYRGAVGALERGGPDWERHSMVSFRELATHVLHLLSPDVEVLKIAEPDEIHDGRPTRRVRFRYIFGLVAEGAVTKFFEADMKAAIELFEFLNRGTHKLGTIATSAQVRYIRSRLVGLVTSMMDARDI